MNVPPIERVATGALGAAAVAYGLDRRDPLGYALAAGGAVLAVRAASGLCPAYRRFLSLAPLVDVSRSATILADRATVFRAFRSLEKLPSFLEHVSRVETTGPKTSRWTIQKGPLSRSWDVQITEEVEDRRLAWESLPGGDVEAEGAIELRDAPGDRGTEMTIRLRYGPPGPLAWRPFQRLLGEVTSHGLARELGRFRQLIETGAIATGASRPEAVESVEAASAAEIGMPVPERRQVSVEAPTDLVPAGAR